MGKSSVGNKNLVFIGLHEKLKKVKIRLNQAVTIENYAIRNQ